MTTSPKAVAVPLPDPISPPVIPLTPAARAAYQALNDTYEAAIEATTDLGALEALNASQLDVSNVLTKDDMYRLQASTELYHALLLQIDTTNKGLRELQQQVAAVPAGFAHAADILNLLETALKVIPLP